MTWEKVQFPKSKDEIELFVMQRFVAAGRDAGFEFLAVEQNPENHFDFSLTLPGGAVYMDLMELIYRDDGAPPFDSNNGWVLSSEFAGQIVAKILDKSSRYQSRSGTPIHLLTYATHWRFVPAETVIRLVQHGLSEANHVFENVFFFDPEIDEKEGLRVLCPSEQPLEGHDPREFGDHKYLPLDPGKAVLFQN
jgi:hypothetical protein